ncbi:MAG: 2-hydroxyacyl-CoA dehydratase [Clostridia bacterium]|nr:2-hydroxyacyl-CoA dehydratase [Clostridia bacterium]
MRIGLDIGSTTIKCVVLDDKDKIIYSSYERHFSEITKKLIEVMKKLQKEVVKEKEVCLAISGSAGMGIAEKAKIPFIQEVWATRVAVDSLIPDAETIIELGGEDAKILFLKNGMEVRMNGSCAGGTGAFIDQMATLLKVSVDELNELAKTSERTYVIASRCGVFAKSDIQPLLNQGAQKNDVAKSIFNAVVNQTVVGLAQGREISGKVVYLGGPLTFISELRKSFDEILNIKGVCPENSLYFVSIGTAMKATEKIDLTKKIAELEKAKLTETFNFIKPLFNSQKEYDEFKARHDKDYVAIKDLKGYDKPVYIGIDAGSTTIKFVVVSEEEEILFSSYQSNSGNPVPIICDLIKELYEKYPNIKIKSSAVTGYGEEIIKNAFSVDFGVVETIAHFTAAKKFKPDVDFIIDIGGQDIKCFKIRNGAIDNIFLNEACSSGCGSFLQTFANALGYDIEKFAKLGLFADKPADLGSRCTVFMNSSVKQAQKDGASIENISAGLSISVVKNALYKVIRATTKEELGKNVVVQGGTFYNDAVLRAFEQELDIDVVRPNIAGIMGAYGAALYAKKHTKSESIFISKEKIETFTHKVQTVNCGMCSNNCSLTVNTFEGGGKYISGNRCERPLKKKTVAQPLNIYAYKQELLQSYKPVEGTRGTIGIPLALNMYELFPFWHTFFTTLGFKVVTTPFSSRELYLKGQHTIPSDTVCFPAKLVHGHIEELLSMGVDTIFYPCMTYNLDEGISDNHYNCPVVAYYPEVIKANVPGVKNVKFIYDYVGLHRRKDFMRKITEILKTNFTDIHLLQVKKAVKAAYKEYYDYRNKVIKKGQELIEEARKNNMHIIVLSGRPYHVDPEINHGIDKLIANFNVCVVSEDVISPYVEKFDTTVLNQWTYHARLYATAEYVGDKKDMDLVQLVSFGCGVDAITTDETRTILEKNDKIYTQIKIDEITNLGAVKIRIRSLLAALERDN